MQSSSKCLWYRGRWWWARSYKKESNEDKITLPNLYYDLHGRKEKTPLPLFIGHSVYEKCKSKEVLTSLNKVGVSVSYNEA